MINECTKLALRSRAHAASIGERSLSRRRHRADDFHAMLVGDAFVFHAAIHLGAL
jgi:hypothetical protein